MNQVEKARILNTLHVPETPLVLYNIWDAGGAIAITKAGATAIATGSWSVAAAHGFSDGETIPLNFVLTIVERISQSTDLPLTVDFEGGYAIEPDQIEVNVTKLIQAGAVGLNFEDQMVNGSGLYSIPEQVDRIKAVRRAADAEGVPLFLNARTDVFLSEKDSSVHSDLLNESMLREKAFKEAGADGFFVPGLTDKKLIRTLCKQSTLPVNTMIQCEPQLLEETKQLGVSRISFGPGPYIDAMTDLTARFSRF